MAPDRSGGHRGGVVFRSVVYRKVARGRDKRGGRRVETWVIEEARPPGVGPWNDEPDRARWVDEATGYDCIILRHPSHGNLNGYVGVPAGHPAFGKGYDEVDVEVHGGLTFSAYSDVAQLSDRNDILHRAPAEGRPADVWWFGFDCHHAWDMAPTFEARLREIPGMPLPPFERHDVYRTFDYVKAECESLARQLAAVT
jgi:hypothetical protein